ncbi:recombination mediator RecR [Candidatus Dependentiae bacterium]|nr:recombination mediator RecR [Candidatus Dependentiae bacterium]
MIDQVPTLTQLLKQLQQVPYLASKNLYRVVQHFLDMDQAKAEQFCTALMQAKTNIKKCEKCFVWKEIKNPCTFCSNTKRNQKIVCVTETWQDFIAIEKTGGYQGVYHILGGAISPLDGISPEDLTIAHLIKRIDDDVIDELILAMNQTPEGEATSAYIANKLKNRQIKISCLARGIPVGSTLESMDRITIYKALSERRIF